MPKPIDKEASLKLCSDTHNPYHSIIREFLLTAPTIEAEPWIPCSKRLPENFVWCLVCMSDGCIRLGKWNSEYDEQGVWWVSHPNSGGKLYRIKNVPFWMPLPEPPEREVQHDGI